MKAKFKNLLSRKFLATAATTAAGIGIALSDSTVSNVRIAGLIVAAVSTLIYNMIEGHIDTKNVIGNATETLEKIIKTKEGQTEE